LAVTSEPSGRRPTTSVKVPPRSIQNCQVGMPVGSEGFDIEELMFMTGSQHVDAIVTSA
jgi:hypothetical protein